MTTSNAVSGQVEPPAPVHSLRDIEELEPPYTEQDDIPRYLEAHKVGRMGDGLFDNCIFQCVLFEELFKKIETGEIRPGQPEHDRPARYLLKKSVELLKPLSIKINETEQRYKNLLQESPPGSPLHTTLEKEVGFVTSMLARFETLERNLLDVLAKPETFRPTRDNACFLLFVHAMFADAVNQMQKWMNDLVDVGPEKVNAPWNGSILSYVTSNEVRSNLFSPEPLTPADMTLYEGGLWLNEESDTDLARKSVVPSISNRGSQGLLAIMYGIFHGTVLLSAAILEPYPVHGSTAWSHASAFGHDGGHLDVMLNGTQILTHVAPKLKAIFSMVDPASNLPPDVVKRDLVVLFHMLHESTGWETMFRPGSNSKLFIDRVRRVFNKDFAVVDTVPLLNKVGFSISGIEKNSPRKEKEACYEAVAQAMDTLWKEFRQRHADVLKASGLFSEQPNFFVD